MPEFHIKNKTGNSYITFSRSFSHHLTTDVHGSLILKCSLSPSECFFSLSQQGSTSLGVFVGGWVVQ